MLVLIGVFGGCAKVGAVPVEGAGAGGAAEAVWEVRGELRTEGGLGERLSREAADLVILYGGEQKGEVGTCGCPKRPRGSLARLAGYAEAVREQGAPVVMLNPGGFLDDPVGIEGDVIEERVARNHAMRAGLRAMAEAGVGYDGVNLGASDLVGVAAGGIGAWDGVPIFSSNVEGEGAGLARQVIVEREGRAGKIRIGVVGVHAPQPTTLSLPWRIRSVSVAGDQVRAVAEQADVVVLLAWYAPEEAKRLAERYPEIDAVIVAGGHQDYIPPAKVGNAIWTTSTLQTMRVGELRLRLDEQGRVIGAVDRKIDLDDRIPEQREVAAALRQNERKGE